MPANHIYNDNSDASRSWQEARDVNGAAAHDAAGVPSLVGSVLGAARYAQQQLSSQLGHLLDVAEGMMEEALGAAVDTAASIVEPSQIGPFAADANDNIVFTPATIRSTSFSVSGAPGGTIEMHIDRDGISTAIGDGVAIGDGGDFGAATIIASDKLDKAEAMQETAMSMLAHGEQQAFMARQALAAAAAAEQAGSSAAGAVRAEAGAMAQEADSLRETAEKLLDAADAQVAAATSQLVGSTGRFSTPDAGQQLHQAAEMQQTGLEMLVQSEKQAFIAEQQLTAADEVSVAAGVPRMEVVAEATMMAAEAEQLRETAEDLLDAADEQYVAAAARIASGGDANGGGGSGGSAVPSAQQLASAKTMQEAAVGMLAAGETQALMAEQQLAAADAAADAGAGSSLLVRAEAAAMALEAARLRRAAEHLLNAADAQVASATAAMFNAEQSVVHEDTLSAMESAVSAAEQQLQGMGTQRVPGSIERPAASRAAAAAAQYKPIEGDDDNYEDVHYMQVYAAAAGVGFPQVAAQQQEQEQQPDLVMPLDDTDSYDVISDGYYDDIRYERDTPEEVIAPAQIPKPTGWRGSDAASVQAARAQERAAELTKALGSKDMNFRSGAAVARQAGVQLPGVAGTGRPGIAVF